MADSKAEAEAAKVAAAQAKIAIAAARSAQAQQQAAAQAAASMAQQAIAAEKLAQLQEAGARRAAEAAEQSAQRQSAAAQRAAQAQARSNMQGMAQMSRMLDAKHKADADAALSAAKAEAVQTKATAQAAVAQAKVQAIQAKAATTAQDAGKSQEALGSDLMSMASNATHAGGVIGMLQNQLAKLGPVGQAAAVAIGVATIAVTAFGGALVTAMGFAIEATEKINRLKTVLTALAGSSAGGTQALNIIKDLGKSLPFTTGQISEWARSLMSAGFEGQKLKDALQAVAAATALMGEEGGEAAAKFLKTLQEGGQAASQLIKTVQAGGRKAATALAQMGLTSKDLAAALGVSEEKFKTMTLSADQLQKAVEAALAKKGKGPLEEMALTWPVMIAKLKEGFFSLFSGVAGPVKAFMSAVKSLFSEFYKGGAATNAIKPMVTAVLKTAFEWATKVVKAVHEMVQGFMGTNKAQTPFTMIGAALKRIWDSAVKVWQAVSKMFGGKDSGAKMQMWLTAIALAAENVADTISFVIDVVAAVIDIFTNADSIFDSVVSTLSGLADSALSAGGNFIDGLVQGIQNGAGAIIAAVTGIAGSALGAFKSALGIASPSKVMMAMGGHMATGVAEGVDDGAPKAQAATARMVDPKALKVGGASGGGAAGKTYQFYGCDFSGTSESAIRAMMMKIEEEDSLAGPEASPA